MLASGGADRTIRLWELATGKECLALEGHRRYLNAVAFSPDGATLASGSWDETIRLWDVAERKALHSIAGQSGTVLAVSFSHDGKHLAAGFSNAKIRIWAVVSPDRSATDPSITLDALWNDLVRNDASQAFASMQALGRGGGDVVPFLKRKLGQTEPDRDQADRIREAIRDLGDDEVDVRERAGKELLSLGFFAEPAIRGAVSNSGFAEATVRGERVLDILQHPIPIPPGESLRRHRAIRMLEQIGSEESKAGLEMLARESPSLRERREAKMALERVMKRH